MDATTAETTMQADGSTRDESGRRSGGPRLRRPHLRGRTNVADAERALSVLGGGALALWGLRERGLGGTLAALAGAVLVQRGVTGHCPLFESLGMDTAGRGDGGLVQQHGRAAVLDASRAIKVERTVTIDRPREELYRYWRQLENLPRIMRHLESVRVLDARRSHWVARAPAGRTVAWDAVIHNEIENELLAWKSEDGAEVPNAGSVHFTDASGGRGTELRVVLEYVPPAGRLGAAVARLFHEEPEQQIREDLHRFKAEMEGAATVAAR